MSMIGCPIIWRPGHAFALILLLSFVLIAPPPALADAEHDPIAAMVAKVSPAVVRVITVRPLSPGESKPTAAAASNVAGELTSTALGFGCVIGGTANRGPRRSAARPCPPCRFMPTMVAG
jgi:hypothetical protein